MKRTGNRVWTLPDPDGTAKLNINDLMLVAVGVVSFVETVIIQISQGSTLAIVDEVDHDPRDLRDLRDLVRLLEKC